MRKQPRGFAKGIFFFALIVMILLVYLLLHGCSMVYGQEGKVVKERAKFFFISEEKFFRMPIDSVSVSKAKAVMNNVSYEAAKNKTGFRSDIKESFKNNKKLLSIIILWYVEHWKYTSDGFIYREAVIKYVARNGRFRPEESWVVEYEPVIHVHKKPPKNLSKKIERTRNE